MKQNWSALGQAFENLGNRMLDDCCNMEINCEVDERYKHLYANYAQMLESIKVQLKVINDRFDELDAS